MERVAVVGSGGAGKTTFSNQLGKITGLPVVHLDEEYWRPGWVETPREEWQQIVETLASKPAWIIDGNYGGSLAPRIERADTVVLFDLPRWTCLRRALWRSIRNYGRAVQAAGCPERLNREFLTWVWRYPKQSRPRVHDTVNLHGGRAALFVVRRSADARRLLERIGNGE